MRCVGFRAFAVSLRSVPPGSSAGVVVEPFLVVFAYVQVVGSEELHELCVFAFLLLEQVSVGLLLVHHLMTCVVASHVGRVSRSFFFVRQGPRSFAST